jgi:hypothetical protein
MIKLKENNPVKGRRPNGEKPRGGLASLRGTLRPITKQQITNNHQLPNYNNQT